MFAMGALIAKMFETPRGNENMEIKPNETTDDAFWIPVRKPSSKMPLRAFLPLSGFDGWYCIQNNQFKVVYSVSK
jgi:hypothetical protein